MAKRHYASSRRSEKMMGRHHKEKGTASQMAHASSEDMFPYLGGSWLSFESNEMAGMPKGFREMEVPYAKCGLNRAVPGNIESINGQIAQDHDTIVQINTHPRKV